MENKKLKPYLLFRNFFFLFLLIWYCYPVFWNTVLWLECDKWYTDIQTDALDPGVPTVIV